MEETQQKTTKVENTRRENGTMAELNINILREMSFELNNGERKCVLKMTGAASNTFTLEVIVKEIECINDLATIYTEPGEFMFDLSVSTWEIIDEDGWKTYKVSEEIGNFYYFCFI